MCGIVGLWTTRSESGLEPLVERLAATLSHRGPDEAGAWVDAAAGFALGHRRLTVLELSPAGHQPMISACERYVIAFNGEIYNHLDLRDELETAGAAPPWRGHSDTETLLAALSHWGVAAALARTRGMFALALWDRRDRALILARDRIGEKPVYYGWQGATFLFASELKALRAHPEFRGEVERGALALFLRHNYIPAPYSIYRGVSKLPPGTWLRLRAGEREPTITPYWSATKAVEEGLAEPFRGTEGKAVDALEALLKDAIRQQMVADVPLGAFLSGGLDSSTVVALMQAQSSRPVRTFSIGFAEGAYNEAAHAKAVARHLGTDHTELYVTPEEALAVIPKLPTLYDEPFADSSQIPTYLVAQMARRHVTVALSGDAGDELFAGYNRYFLASRIWHSVSRMPQGLRTTVSKLLTILSPTTLDRIGAPLLSLAPKKLRTRSVGDQLHKFAQVLKEPSGVDVYQRLVSHWDDPAALAIDAVEPPTRLTDQLRWPTVPSLVEWMMALDLVTYLPDDILVKVDRAAMGVSLESRVPFLDHRVVEFAWKLPLQLKVRRGTTKWILRQVLYRYVPKHLVERPKMGFGLPIDTWLRGPLREWAEALIEPARLEREGYLRSAPIREKWKEHLSGRRNWQYHLWDILMFQSWLEQQGQG